MPSFVLFTLGLAVSAEFSNDGSTGPANPVLSNIAAWYRYGVGITHVANAVSQWADQSGNARHLLQATAAQKPTLQSSNAIRFDGVVGGDNLKATFTLNQPSTRYALMRQIGWTSARALMDGVSGTQLLRQQPSGSGGNTPEIEIHAGTAVGSDANLAIGALGVVSTVFDGASSFLGVNSNAGATLNAGTGNPGGLTIGSNSANSTNSSCEFWEVIVYSVAHDASTRAQVISYLYDVYTAAIPYFAQTGANQLWYGNSITPPAIYFADTNKTWVVWEASTPPGAGGTRQIEGRAYDHALGTYSAVTVVGTVTLTDDDHGVPTLCRDDDGYVYCFYGAHGDPQQVSVTTNPNDPTAWTARTAIGLQMAYPHPDVVGGVIYLFNREDTTSTDRELCVTKSLTLAPGDPTWGALKSLASFGPNARFYGGNHVVRGTDIHMTATRAEEPPGDVRLNVYYYVYDTVTGAMRNYDNTVSVASGSQPVTLTQANTSFRLFEHTPPNDGAVPTLAFDTNGFPHVVFLDGDATWEVKHIWHDGTAWQSVVATGFTSDGSITLVSKADGVMRLYWTDGHSLKRADRSAAGVWGVVATIAIPRVGTNGYSSTARIVDGEEFEIVFADYNPGVVSTEIGTLKAYGIGESSFMPQGTF